MKQLILLKLIIIFINSCSFIENKNVIKGYRETSSFKEDAFGEELKSLKSEIQLTVPNGFGAMISEVDGIDKIEDFIEKFKSLIKDPGFQDSKYVDSKMIQDISLEVIGLLIKGRGTTYAGDGTGWIYLKHESFLSQLIDTVLDISDLDSDGAIRFEEILNSDFKNPEFVKSRGFPPGFQVINDGQLSKLRSKLEGLNLRSKPYSIINKSNNELLLRELIDQSSASTVDKNASTSLLNDLEGNLYDKAINTLNDGDKDFINYFGRTDELNDVIEGLSRLEKAHILLTGKAGVGKTTILKMLQNKLVQGEIKLSDEKTPVVLELPITSVTNYHDPTLIKNYIRDTKTLAKVLDRRVILYIDEAHISTTMARNAIKGFLTEKLDDSKVHFIWSTTSQEARTFLSDAAFIRRWVSVLVREFSQKESIDVVKTAYLPLWKKFHKVNGLFFDGISEESFEFASKYFPYEQPHAANPTGLKEFLEGAIARKKRILSQEGTTGGFSIEIDDLREYLKNKVKVDLVPGDKNFNDIFEEKWAGFEKDYIGNEALKLDLKSDIFSYFSTLNKKKMSARVLFGPPGAGKSFAAEKVAEHFFDGATLTINAADYKDGGLGLNKLIGSPTGTVGSEEQRSILTRFMSDNPRGIIVIEEMDYAHQDLIKFFTNIISDGTFTDGLGKEWDTSQYMIVGTSNIGQDYMIPSDAENKMTWEQLEIRKNELLETVEKNGKEVKQPKRLIVDKIFDSFISEIVTNSNPHGDTSKSSQEAAKQKRRMKSSYVLLPERDELLSAGKAMVRKFNASMDLDYGVKIKIDESDISKFLDLDNVEFEKGYSYVEEQLENKLFSTLRAYSVRGDSNINLKLEESSFEGKRIEKLIFEIDGQKDSYFISSDKKNSLNAWASSDSMKKKIKSFSRNMSEYVKGMSEEILQTKKILKLKQLNWDTRVVLSLVGTSGNGKTEFAKSVAKSLYGSSKAMFKITAKSKYDLNNYFRPPTAFSGGKEETEFERWFKSRQKSGGGVILFDELLSYSGLGQQQLADRIEILNELYDLLDEGKLKIGNKIYDASAFIIINTGNSLQELFSNIPDTPEAEDLVKKVTKNTSPDQIVRYLEKVGLDAPKVARLGKIFLKGPLEKSVALSITKKVINADFRNILNKSGKDIDFIVDENLTKKLVNEVTTIKLGMRDVNRAVNDLLLSSFAELLIDIPDAKKIEVKLSKTGIVEWFVNSKEVKLSSEVFEDFEEREWDFIKNLKEGFIDKTPQFSDIVSESKVVLSENDLKIVAIHEIKGHWMADFLLSGKNNAEVINLIPGNGYLGYVLPKDKSNVAKTLSSVFQDIIMLEAGHRAVFKEGIYAFGGGSSGVAQKRRTDDLGRVNGLIDDLMSNQIFKNFTEFSDPKSKGLFKEVLRELGKNAADYLIDYGNENKIADDLYGKVLRDKYISVNELDKISENIELKKSNTVLFSEAIESSISSYLDQVKIYDENKLRIVQDLLKDFSTKTLDELKAFGAGSGVDKIKKNIAEKIKGLSLCSSHLKK